MTCVVGLVDSGTVWLGADSVSSGEEITEAVWTPKLFRRGAYSMGIAASWRVGQLLQHGLDSSDAGPLDPPSPDGHGADFDQALDAHMCRDFVGWVQSTLEVGRSLDMTPGRAHSGARYLVAVHGYLYDIDSSFSVARPMSGYTAIGSGAEVALGAMHATADLRVSPPARVRRALLAAVTHNAFVGEPLHILEHQP